MNKAEGWEITWRLASYQVKAWMDGKERKISGEERAEDDIFMRPRMNICGKMGVWNGLY